MWENDILSQKAGHLIQCSLSTERIRFFGVCSERRELKTEAPYIPIETKLGETGNPHTISTFKP